MMAASSRMPTDTPLVSIVLPTLDAKRWARPFLAALGMQRRTAFELIVIDSDSTDGTPEAFRDAGARVLTIRREAFDHGATRNLGAREARGNILVFMTQDVEPIDDTWLDELIEPLVVGIAPAAYARQVPRHDANPLERYARRTNYPAAPRVVSVADVPSLGVRAAFFSNACSAICKDVFEDLGGFPTGTIMNEDMLFAVRLLQTGHSIAYVPDARVWHSHDYGPLATLNRYFDIGVVFSESSQLLAGFPASGAGARYAIGSLRSLMRERDYRWIPASLLESLSKAVGFTLGRHHRSLPRSVVRWLSLHKGYWADG